MGRPHDDIKLGLHKTARYYYYPGWHEPGTTNKFGFNKKAYDAVPVDLQRTLDHATAAVRVYSLTDYHVKNAIALERLKTEFKDKVEILQFPPPALRDLKKLAAEVVREQSEKTPMARKVHASFTKFQALVGPGTASPKARTISSSRVEGACITGSGQAASRGDSWIRRTVVATMATNGEVRPWAQWAFGN